MNRLTSVLLLGTILLFGLWACGPSNNDQTNNSTPTTVEEPPDGLPLCPPVINEERPAHFMGMLADVYDGPSDDEFYDIPEVPLLQTEQGQLADVHLMYQHFKVGPDNVWLRSYRAERMKREVTAPVGPTFRIKPTGRVTVRIHNDLPLNQNWNYLYMLENTPENIALLNGGASQALLDVLDAANAAEVKRRAEKSTGMIHITDYNQMVVTPRGDDEDEWRITAHDSAMIVKLKKNWNQDKKMLFVYLEFYTDNSNIAHDFNNTNLHFHGSHVSPFQDDVLRTVNPTLSSYYTYDLVQHQPGTHWYHPHVHGSTAMQVASGMSGVIIVEEDLAKFPALRAASAKEREKVMVFDQLQYDTINGELTDFNMLTLLGGNNGLQTSGARGTVINGKIKPTVTLKAGECARWRILHKGFHSGLVLWFPEEVQVWQIAVDGVMFDQPRQIKTLHLAPGNRSDVLIKVPAGTAPSKLGIKSISYDNVCEYFVTDTPCVSPTTANPEDILFLNVDGKMANMPIPKRLPLRAPELRENVTGEMAMTRNTMFNILVATPPTQFVVNGKEFDGNRIDNKPLLGTKEEWIINSGLGGHPYHIHINPFQVWELDGRELPFPMWKDVAFVNQDKPIKMRTHYHRYWGDFVMHCHILDHEDQGMMQRVTIVRNKRESDLEDSKSNNPTLAAEDASESETAQE